MDPISIQIILHSSDALDMSLVNAVFDGRGYQGWKRSLLIAFSAKSKLGFINGNCPAPAPAPAPAPTSKDFQPWSRCNDMVTFWLLNSLSKDIGDGVIYSKSARNLWTSLEHRFGQSNGAKLYHLDLLNEFNIADSSCVASLLHPSSKLTAESEPPLSNPTLYQHLVVELNYLTHTKARSLIYRS